MNKILKKALAFTVVMFAGVTVASAKNMSIDDIKELSNVDGDYDLIYVHGHTAFDRYINMTDILHSSDEIDYNLYLKDSYNNWIYADTNKPADVESFDITELVGDAKYSDHVSAYTDLYTDKYSYVDTTEYGFDGDRVVDIFKSEKELEAEQPVITVDTTAFATQLEETFGFKASDVYADGITLGDGVVSAILKENTAVAAKYDNNVSGKTHFFAYVLTVPTADDSTVIELNSKVLKATCGAEDTNCTQLVWDNEETKSLFIVVGVDETTLTKPYTIKVTVNGKTTDLSLDLSGIKFQKASVADKVLFNEFTDAAYKADLESMKTDDLWKYDYTKNTEYQASLAEGSTTKYLVTGNLAKMPDVVAYPGETGADYYFTFAFKLDVNTYKNLVVTTQRTGSAPKTFTANDMKEGIFTLLQNVKNDLSTVNCENNKCTTTVTIDLDGSGVEYLPTTYTIDYSGVTLGSLSKLEVVAADDQTYLLKDFGWVTPEKYITIDPDETDTTKFYVNGTLSKYVSDISKAGFGDSATGYYLAFKISVLNDGNMRDNGDITIEVDNNGSQKTLTKDNFDNAHDIYVLAQIDPANVKDLTKRVITYTIDLDGAKDEYAPQTYTLDWSTLGFSEDSRATLTIRNNDQLSYSQRKITGEIMETELNSGIYKFNLTVIPALNTTLNGHLTEIPEDIIVKIGDKTYTASDFDANNSLVKEVELDSKATDKRIFVTIDLDGDGETFNPYTYPVSYSGVTFKYYTGVKAIEPEAGDFDVLDIATVGKMETLNTKDKDGKDVVYVRGYALETDIDESLFDVAKGYFLPLSFEVINKTHLTGIKLSKGSMSDTNKEYSSATIDNVKNTGVFNLVRWLSEDGEEFTQSETTFTLTFTYDDETEKVVTVDLSGVKFGYAAMYADAYEKTINSEYTHTEKTLFKFGSDDGQSEYPDLIDFMTILKPRNISGYSSYETSDSITSLKLQVNPGTINPIIKAVGLDGSGEYAGGGLFKSPVYFVVKIDANGYIISFDAECSSGVFNTHPQFKDSVSGKEYVMESMTMHYELSGHVAKNETKVEFDDGKTLETQATELKDQFYGKTSSDKTLSDLTDPEFKKVYTKVGTVNDPSLTKIKIGDREYTNEPTYISVGDNKYLNVPVFVIIKDELWVSNVHLMAEYYPTVKVVYDDFTYEVPTSATEHTIEIDSVAAINPSDTNKVSEPVFDEATGRWVITHTSASGSNMIGIKLKVDGELINTAGKVIYRINDDAGDMGVTVSEDKGGTVYAYTAYTAPYDGPVTKVSRNSTLIVPGKGIIKIRIDVIPVEAE